MLLFELFQSALGIHLVRVKARAPVSRDLFDEAVADLYIETIGERVRGVCREQQNLLVPARTVQQMQRGGRGRCRFTDAAFAAEEKIMCRGNAYRLFGRCAGRLARSSTFFCSRTLKLLPRHRSSLSPASQKPPASSPPASISNEEDSAVCT